MSQNITILVADDSLTYRMAIEELLSENEYHVELAQDGRIAWKKIQESPPDLAILDVVMPEIDGVQLCKKIKSSPQTEFIPVILLTSKSDSNDKIEGLEAGADEYLTKPFNEVELLAKLRTQLRIRLLRNEQGASTFSLHSSILIGDEDENYRRNLATLMKQSGYRVIEADTVAGVKEGLQLYLPDLIILRPQLEGWSGIELCREIKNSHDTEQIPVFMIGDESVTDQRIAAFEAGAEDSLPHDIDPEELSAKINAVFRTKKMHLMAEGNILAKKNQQLEQVNRELKATQAQLIQNEKMVALGQLVAGIAHEVNNPLSYVINNSYILKETFEGYAALQKLYEQTKPSIVDPDLRNAIEELEEEIDPEYLRDAIPKLYRAIDDGLGRIRTIVLALKNFSRLDEAEQKKTDVKEGIESTLQLMQHEMKSRIRVVKEFHPVPDVNCYPSQLNQVFMNVIANAIQAIEGIGTITIKVYQKGAHLLVEFTDTGRGIKPEILGKIFDPFYTTKPVGRGTGLGLTISYRIIEKHRGEIQFSSIEGQGTTCTIKLPIQ